MRIYLSLFGNIDMYKCYNAFDEQFIICLLIILIILRTYVMFMKVMSVVLFNIIIKLCYNFHKIMKNVPYKIYYII